MNKTKPSDTALKGEDPWAGYERALGTPLWGESLLLDLLLRKEAFGASEDAQSHPWGPSLSPLGPWCLLGETLSSLFIAL